MLAAMFLAVYLLFFLGNDAMLGELMTVYVKDQVKTVIADEDRRKLALKGLSNINDDINDLNKTLSKDAGQFEKLIKNYHSTPQEFDQLFSMVLAKRQQQVDKIWDDRKAMLQHIQRDEWRAIMSGAQAAMEKKKVSK